MLTRSLLTLKAIAIHCEEKHSLEAEVKLKYWIQYS